MQQRVSGWVTVCLALSVALAMVGCNKQFTTSVQDRSAVSHGPAAITVGKEVPTADSTGSSAASNEVRVADLPIATPTAPSRSISQEAAAAPIDDLSDVYFDYDRFTLKKDAQFVLMMDARILKSKDGMLTIAGHCDERGTAAYNLVLGEKRAQSARHYLEDLGISPSRLRVVSYGKEKPFCQEHNSRCWQSNRRAHLSLP